MISIGKIFWFSASHTLPHHDGACARQHGHNYKLEVVVTGKIVDKGPSTGMIMDFGDLDSIVHETIMDVYDHRHLNDIYDNPTAENMVERIAARIQSQLPVATRTQVVKLKLWETEKCYAEWTADN
jgi:6-pyruvoyltetrahydropterin/6-carboxytetrahydropterin synthase